MMESNSKPAESVEVKEEVEESVLAQNSTEICHADDPCITENQIVTREKSCELNGTVQQCNADMILESQELADFIGRFIASPSLNPCTHGHGSCKYKFPRLSVLEQKNSVEPTPESFKPKHILAWIKDNGTNRHDDETWEQRLLVAWMKNYGGLDEKWWQDGLSC